MPQQGQEQRIHGAEENTRVPPRRRGGQELPDSVQDRPEQSAGDDAAVRGDGRQNESIEEAEKDEI
jgi:hypothetical protein